MFVNVKLFDLIVLTCNESTNELVVSSVTLSGQQGSPKDTIGAVPANLASKGVTQADLCGIASGSYGGLNAATYDASVKLPKE